MRTKRLPRRWVTVAPVLLCVQLLIGASCAPTTEGGREVPLRVVSGDRGSALVLAPVVIGDREPVLFALDTGASETLIDRRVADRLGLAPIPGSEREVSGIGAADAVELQIDSWQLGDIDLPPLRVASLTLPEPEGSPVAGLLGNDVLGAFERVTIDYEDEVLVLHGGAATPTPAP